MLAPTATGRASAELKLRRCTSSQDIVAAVRAAWLSRWSSQGPLRRGLGLVHWSYPRPAAANTPVCPRFRAVFGRVARCFLRGRGQQRWRAAWAGGCLGPRGLWACQFGVCSTGRVELPGWLRGESPPPRSLPGLGQSIGTAVRARTRAGPEEKSDERYIARGHFARRRRAA